MTKFNKLLAWFLFISLNLSAFGASAAVEKDAQWVNQVFQKGKAYYEAGDYKAAIHEWNSLDPVLDQYPSFKKVIGYLKSQILSAPRANLKTTVAPGVPKDTLDSAVLDESQSRVRKEVSQLASERVAIQNGEMESDAWLQQTFEKGRAAFRRGDWDEAMDLWGKVAGRLNASSPQARQIAEMRQEYQMLKKLRRQVEEERSSNNIPLELPPALRADLEEALRKIRAEQQEANLQTQVAKKNEIFQEAWIRSTFDRAKEAYARGDMVQAADQWERLALKLEDKPELLEKVREIKRSYAELESARESARVARDKQRVEMAWQDDFGPLLGQASEQLTTQLSKSRSDRAAQEKDLIEKQAWAKVTYDAGKISASQGKWTDAVTEWEKLAPYLDPDSQEGQRLKDLRKAMTDLEAAKKDAGRELPEGYLVSRIAADLAQTLREASAKLRNDAIEIQRKSTTQQQSVIERQRMAELAFEKGKVFYDSGDAARATEEWASLKNYLTPGSSEAKLLEALEQDYAGMLHTTQMWQKTQSETEKKIMPPSQMLHYLQEAKTQVGKRSQEARSRKDEAESFLLERRNSLEASTTRGKLLFEKGDLDGALREWSSTAAWMDEPSQKILTETVRTREQESSALRDVDLIERQKSTGLETPLGLPSLLSQINQKARLQLQEAMDRRTAAQQSVADRQAALNSMFEKGKLYYQAGDISGSLDAWASVVREVNDPSLTDQLTTVQKNVDAYNKAQQEAALAEQKRGEKLSPPQEIFKLLQEASLTVDEDLGQVRTTRGQLDKEYAERQAAFATHTSQGRDLLKQGQYAEAVSQLDKMRPYLDEKSPFGEELQKFKQTLKTLGDAKLSNDKFVSNEFLKIKVPLQEELTELLSSVADKLDKDTQASKQKQTEMEKALTERWSWTNATFEKGKVYADAGKYEEAFHFWASLLPNLDRENEFRALMDSATKSLQNAKDARLAAENAEAAKLSKLPPPAELSKLLEDLSEKFRNEHFDAVTEAEKSGQALLSRKAEMNKIFDQGLVLYQAGNLSGALTAWGALPPYVTDEIALRTALEELLRSHQQMEAAQKTAAQAAAEQSARLAAPSDLAILLADASLKLAKETQVAELSRQRSENLLKERDSKLQGVFAEGKAQYDQGKLNAAFLTWRTLLPFLKDEQEVESQLTKAEQSYQAYVLSKDLNQQTLAKKEAKIAAPSELVEILDQANRQLGDEIFELKNKTFQTEKMLTDRQSWVETTFQKGKFAYSQGRFKEAVAEWNTLLPFIENGQMLKDALNDFERNLRVSLDSTGINREAEAKKNTKFAAPDELGVLLVQLNDKVKNEALEAGAEKIKAEQAYSERQQRVTRAFEQGKVFYDQGQMDKALDEWGKLGPYLEEGSGIQKLLDAVKQSYQESMNAKKSAVESAAKDYQGLKLPYADQMSKLLTEADQKMQEQASQYKVKKQEVERTMADRQEWSVTTFNKGKVYYDQGQFDEALNQWERLLPYLADGSDMKLRIQSLRQNHDTLQAGKNALGDPATKKERSVILKNEQEILQALTEANDKLKSQTDQVRAIADAAQKEIRDRQEWIQYTFDKGKAFFDQGNYAKAVEEWGILGPYLSEYPSVRDQIEEAKKQHAEGRTAEKVIENMEVKKASLLPLPAVAAASQADGAVPQMVQRTPAPQGDGEIQEPPGAQLVSGEIVSIDTPQRTLTLKLYTDSGTEETLTVNYDDRTQVDGSESASITAVENGTNIDLRYNPQTSRALYIYVY